MSRRAWSSEGPGPASETGGDEGRPTLERRLAAWMLAGIDGARLWRALAAEAPPVAPVPSLPLPGPARSPADPPQAGAAATGQAAWSRGGAAAARGMEEAGDPAGE